MARTLGALRFGDKLATMRALRERYGDIVRFSAGPRLYHILNAPEQIQHVLQERARNYPKGTNYGELKHFLGNGLFTSDGAYWLRQRRLAQPAFHRERVAAFGRLMVDHVCRMLGRWEAAPAAVALDVAAEMSELTLEIVCATLFGTSIAGDAKRVGDALAVALRWIDGRVMSVVRLPPRLPTPANRRAHRAIAELDQVLWRIVEERRRDDADRGDLMSMFLAARDEATGERMSDAELRDELTIMVLAGHETSANALTWTWHLLGQHPEVEAKLHAELARVLAGRVPGERDLAELPYTRAVVQEAMRLYPPLWWFERQPLEDDELAGYHVPAGSIVGITPYVMHRHPDHWPDADRFLPDRFLPGAPERHRFAYLPFGGGPRQCIGNTFALMEAQLIVAAVAQRFQLRAVEGRAVVPEPIGTLRVAGGMPMRLARR